MSEQEGVGLPWYRRALSVGGALTAAGTTLYMSMAEGLPVAMWGVSGALMGSVWLSRRRGLGAQILARGIWWQAVLLGGLMLVFGSSIESQTGLALAGGGGLALLAAGAAGLKSHSDLFKPTAFRRSLMLAMVLALADIQALSLYGAARAEIDHNLLIHMPLFVCAGVMAVAAYGLYRLKLWGLLLNIVANLTIATLALTGGLAIHEVLAYTLASTAALQLLIPLPMIRNMLKKGVEGKHGRRETAEVVMEAVCEVQIEAEPAFTPAAR